MFEWLTDNAFVVDTPKQGALVQLVGTRDQTFGARGGGLGGGGAAQAHVPWGEQDNRPNIMNKLKAKNGQVKPLLKAQRDMIYGSGLGFFKRIIENGKQRLDPFADARLDDWALQTRLQHYVIGAINELVTNGNTFTRFEFEVDGTPILNVSDCFFTRIGSPKKGIVTDYLLNPNFGEGSFNAKESERVPAFDFKDPTANLVSILHGREHESGNPFYDFPSWWCNEDWIELANLIPLFHKSGIKNGYNIKYIIKMPRDYFDKEGEQELAEDKVKAKWNAFGENLKNWLSGVDNVNKSLLVRYLRGEDGKALDSIDVVPMKNDGADDAYTKVWEMSGVSITNGVGILPVLGGVTPGSKSGDSGAQIRVVADYQQHFRTPVHRLIVLEPIIYALRAMGYRDIVPQFVGVQLTTLDANPNGKQAVIDQK